MPGRTSHRYNIGDIHGEMKILNQTREWDGTANIKAYSVKCLICGYERVIPEKRITKGNGLYHSVYSCKIGHLYSINTVVVDMKILELTTVPVEDGERKGYLVECTKCNHQKIIAEAQIKRGDGLTHASCTRNDYKFDINQVIGELRVIAQTKKWNGQFYKKAYELECIECGNKKILAETDLVAGDGIYHSNYSCHMGYLYIVGDEIGDYMVIEQTVLQNGDYTKRAYFLVCKVCGWQKIVAEAQIKKKSGVTHATCGTGYKDSGSRFHKCWLDMKQRCENPNNKFYPDYGGRGITHKFPYFWDFKQLMEKSYWEHATIHGEWNTTLDRIDVDGNYEKNNIKWATWEVQANNRRNTIYYKYSLPDGEVGVDTRPAILKYYNKGPAIEDPMFNLLDPFPANIERISKEQYIFWQQVLNKLDTLSEYYLKKVAFEKGISIKESDSFEFVRNKLVEYLADKEFKSRITSTDVMLKNY